MTPHPSPSGSAQSGFAIIEALIALLLFSLGVLGLVGLQASLTRATASAKYRAEAAYLASDLIGKMWIDAANLVQYTGTNCAAHPQCLAWQNKVSGALPVASTDISLCQASDTGNDCRDSLGYQTLNRVVIQIQWSVPGEGAHVYRTSTNITP